MGKRTTRALSLMLVLIMALSIFAVSYAATTKYAKSAVNVRSGPGTSYAVIGELEKGQSVTATGKTVGNWTQIQFSRYELGYVSSSYLTSRVSSNSGSSSSSGKTAFKVCSDCGDIYYATTALNVRKGPGTSYSVVGSLCKGQQVTRIGKSGNWYQLLTTDGSTAYASASYLKLYKASTGSSCTTGSSSSTTTASVYYATTGLNVRKGPGTSYSIVDELEKGEKVYATGNVSGSWYQVRTLSGKVGYCYKSYLTTKAPSGSSSSVSGNACSYYYCHNCKWYVPVGQLCTGCKNTCTNNGYNWNCSICNKNCNNTCTIGCAVSIGSYYITNYKTKLYLDDSTSCGTVCTLPAGTRVVVVGLSGYNWAKVRIANSVTTGYVPVDAIK